MVLNAKGSELTWHINMFNKIINYLRQVDIKFKEEDKAWMLPNSLPDSYHNLVTTLMRGEETLELKKITSVALAFNKRTKA